MAQELTKKLGVAVALQKLKNLNDAYIEGAKRLTPAIKGQFTKLQNELITALRQAGANLNAVLFQAVQAFGLSVGVRPGAAPTRPATTAPARPRPTAMGGEIGLNVLEGLYEGFLKFFPRVGAALGKAKAGLGNMYNAVKNSKAVKQFGDGMKGIATQAIQFSFLMQVASIISSLLDAINPLKPILDAITNGFNILSAIMRGEMADAITMVYDLLLDPEVQAQFQQLGSAFNDMFVALLPMISLFTGPLLDAFVMIIEAVTPIVEHIAGALAPVMNSLIMPITLMANAISALAPILDLIVSIILLATPILDLFTVPLALLSALLEDAKPHLEDLSVWVEAFNVNVVQPFVTALHAWFESIPDWFRQLARDVQAWFARGTYTAEVPAEYTVPMMQHGGIAMREIIAKIGEGNRPEAVIPLDRLETMIGGRGGGVTVNITVAGSVIQERNLVETITREVSNTMARYR